MLLIAAHRTVIDTQNIFESVVLQSIIQHPHYVALCTGHISSKLERDNYFYYIESFDGLSVEDFAILYELNNFKHPTTRKVFNPS
jgi:hypothetical protein